MVSGEFTVEMREQGALLTALLDDAGYTVRASMWLLEPEPRTWLLVFGIAEVDRIGPLQIYKKIQSMISKHRDQLGSLELVDTSVRSLSDPLLCDIRSAVRIPRGEGVRYTRAGLGGRYVEDVYIYRMSRAAA